MQIETSNVSYCMRHVCVWGGGGEGVRVCVLGGGEGSWVIGSTAVSSSCVIDDRIAVTI